MDFDRDLLLKTFTAESFENLAELEESILLLEQGQNGSEHLNTIFRLAHSLKGNALCLGFDHIGEFANRLEDHLERLRDGSVAITPATITQLLRVTDALRDWLPDAVRGDEPAPDRCAKLLEDLWQSHLTPAEPDREAGSERSEHEEQRSQQSQTLRLDIAKLDGLLNLTTEMLIACGRMTGVLQSMPADVVDRLAGSHEEVDRLSRQVNEVVMRARMVPIGPLFRQYARVVRDVSRELGKSARLVIDGADVEIDATAFEYLRDPLTHLVRNAVDHGLETADVRSAAGKDLTGTITLSARQAGRSIIVRVSDDGGGLHEERIMDRARERGIIPADGSGADIRNLIFEPGFTTATEATMVSGRGVGLDVVKANIEKIRGEILLDSSRGEGMTVTIQVPLTVALIDGLVVGVDGENYIIPLDALVECTDLPREARNGKATGMVALHQVAIPFGRLRALVESDRAHAERENLIIVRHHDRLVGMVVDEIVGKRDVVMKPLDDWYRRVPFVSGSTILASGEVALILDVRAAVQHIEATQPWANGSSDAVKSRKGAAA